MNHFSFVSRKNKISCSLGKLWRNLHLGQMKPAVLLSNNYFLALAFLFGWTVDETRSCDTKWIRLVYMMSCGKKKRESVWAQNNTLFENVPPDFDGAFRYFKEKDPSNPMLSDALLYEILEEDGESRKSQHIPKLLLFSEAKEQHAEREPAPAQGSSVLWGKLFPKGKKGRERHLGIQGFPEQWDIEEIIDEKINENHRREIDRLIEECCKVPPVTTCNGNTFSGACK